MRGQLLSWLSIAWAVGYTCAYITGYVLRDHGANAWRLMLASSAIPAAIVFLMRVRIPESPIWLQRRGRLAEAKNIIRTYIGDNILLSSPAASTRTAQHIGAYVHRVFSSKWRLRLFIACFFYTCLVIPYFSLRTFSPIVFESRNIENKFTAGHIYNTFLLIGSTSGAFVVDRVGRRPFLLVGFFGSALALEVLSFGANIPAQAVVGLFAIFACLLSAANNLCFFYPQELFPTDLRATALGFAVAGSRIGSALTTFLFPALVVRYGGQVAVYLCIAVLLIGGMVCAKWAPETRHDSLAG